MSEPYTKYEDYDTDVRQPGIEKWTKLTAATFAIGNQLRAELGGYATACSFCDAFKGGPGCGLCPLTDSSEICNEYWHEFDDAFHAAVTALEDLNDAAHALLAIIKCSQDPKVIAEDCDDYPYNTDCCDETGCLWHDGCGCMRSEEDAA